MPPGTLMPIFLKVTPMRCELPENVQKYSETPTYTDTTVPAGLLRDHSTKAGVWGKLVVTDGHLFYLRDDCPAQRGDEGAPAVIHPEEKHFIRVPAPVSFRVEFYRVMP